MRQLMLHHENWLCRDSPVLFHSMTLPLRGIISTAGFINLLRAQSIVVVRSFLYSVLFWPPQVTRYFLRCGD